MRWGFCQDCHIDGCCENQDRGNKCEVYAKKITEKCDKLEKQLKIAIDCLEKYANEDLWSDYEEGDVIYFDCIFKSLGYDFAQKALKKIERS